MHEMLIKATLVQFDRMHTTMKKTAKEHTIFKKDMQERAEKATYPT